MHEIHKSLRDSNKSLNCTFIIFNKWEKRDREREGERERGRERERERERQREREERREKREERREKREETGFVILANRIQNGAIGWQTFCRYLISSIPKKKKKKKKKKKNF